MFFPFFSSFTVFAPADPAHPNPAEGHLRVLERWDRERDPRVVASFNIDFLHGCVYFGLDRDGVLGRRRMSVLKRGRRGTMVRIGMRSAMQH